MFPRKILLILLFSNCNIALGDDLPLTSSGEIKFYLDYAGFKGEDGKTYQEFYLMFFEDNLSKSINKLDEREIYIETSIVDNFDKNISSNKWTTSIGINRDSSTLNYFAVYDQWAELLEPGNYKLIVTLSEEVSNNSGILRADITVDNFSSEDFSASDIEFVSSYNKKIVSDQFVKGNISVKPNPWRRYGILRPTMLFYYELYNVKKIKNDTLKFTYQIIDAEASVVKDVQSTEVKTYKDTKAVLQGINVSNLPSGIYSLNIEVNVDDKKLLSLTRKFEAIQSDYIELAENSNKIIEMSDNVLPYLESPIQLKRYEKLSENGKINYLIKFWDKFDNTGQYGSNNYFATIMNRYNYTNENFSWGGISGWETERGRVFIQNGNPEEIQRFYFNDTYRPYEVWKYLTDREFIFVFCDINLNDKFILLHSTKEGEIFNAGWHLQAVR